MRILILGGGVIGLSLAAELAKRGHKITVADKRKIGQGASGAGTGLLVHRDARHFHSTFRELYVRSIREFYPKWIQDLKKFQPDLRLEKGGFTLFYSNTDRWNQAQEQFMREGAQDYELLIRDSFNNRSADLPNVPDQKAFHFENEYWIDNDLLLLSLRQQLENLNVEILEEISERPSRNENGNGWTFKKQNYDLLNICSGVWSAEVLEPLGYQMNMHPVKGQVMLIPKSIEFKGVFQVDDSFYMVPRKNGILVGSTSEPEIWEEDFNEFGEANLLKKLENYFGIIPEKIIKSWAGLRPRPTAKRPYIGWLEKGSLFVSCGHFKNGLSMAPYNALLCADLIEQKNTPIDLSSFDPLRRDGVKKKS